MKLSGKRIWPEPFERPQAVAIERVFPTRHWTGSYTVSGSARSMIRSLWSSEPNRNTWSPTVSNPHFP